MATFYNARTCYLLLMGEEIQCGNASQLYVSPIQ